MKHWILAIGLSLLSPPLLWAQDRIWRCGNEYTNAATPEQAKTCKLVSGGNVTVVPAVKSPAGAAVAPKVSTAPVGAPKVEANDQKAKDADARYILESELKKAESRHGELLREYNNGEPEKLASEVRNNQKYLERIADLKASITRNESDMAGIRRELARLPGSANSAAATTSGTLTTKP